MIVLNFAHPLTQEQLAVIERLAGQSIQQVTDVKAQFVQSQPFAEQAARLLDGIGLTGEQLQTESLLINPPALASIACVVLAELHGRMGYFPPVVRIRPLSESLPPEFEVAEIVNLQEVREESRQKR